MSKALSLYHSLHDIPTPFAPESNFWLQVADSNPELFSSSLYSDTATANPLYSAALSRKHFESTLGSRKAPSRTFRPPQDPISRPRIRSELQQNVSDNVTNQRPGVCKKLHKGSLRQRDDKISFRNSFGQRVPVVHVRKKVRMSEKPKALPEKVFQMIIIVE